MKWTKPIYKTGDLKKTSKFLWFPRKARVKDHWEIRWLEQSVLIYKYWNTGKDSGWALASFE